VRERERERERYREKMNKSALFSPIVHLNNICDVKGDTAKNWRSVPQHKLQLMPWRCFKVLGTKVAPLP
jgi:hypothetical protein